MHAKILLMTAALVFLISGCLTEEISDPVLEQVCLEEKLERCVNVSFVGQSIRLALVGLQFHSAYEVNLGDSNEIPVHGRFQAWMDDLALEDVFWVPQEKWGMQAVIATLPRTAPLGTHDVLLQTPVGKQTNLLSAFRLVDPLVGWTETLQPQVTVGGLASFVIHLENTGSVPVTQTTFEFSQEGAGHLLLPVLEPLEISPHASISVPVEAQADQAGDLTLSISVRAMADSVVEIGTESPWQIHFEVTTP
jgi:hypothetical protein